MKKKIIIVSVIGLALLISIGVGRHIYMEQHPKEYVSEVAVADCILCGTPNDYRNTEALSFVLISNERWNSDNVGMVQYCKEDYMADESCIFERYKDESLKPEELAHKNAPFDINGVLKQDLPDQSFKLSKSFFGADNGSIDGTLTVIQNNGLITGAFNISNCKGVDADYLCSVLCQECFDEIHPITREVNFFFVDCSTGQAFPIYNVEEPSFQIGNYTFNVQLQDFRSLIFYATYSEATKRE